MWKPRENSFYEDMRSLVEKWTESDLLLFLIDLGFLDDYSPNLIGERLNRLSPEQKVFLLQKLESEWESPESQKVFLREHLGLNSETEEEFRAKILDVL